MKGLIIKSPWADYILEGKKSWEIRGSNTKIRGEIAIIKSGTGLIYGTAELVDVIKLSKDMFESEIEKHQIRNMKYEELYKKPYAWVFQKPVYFTTPVPYQHPQGAVIWVNLQKQITSI